MRLVSYLPTLLITASLVACGGGGGTGSATPAGSTGGTVVIGSKDPILKLALQDVAETSTTSISASGYTLLKVALTDSSGRPIPNQVIDVTGDTTKIIFPEGNTGLTNSAGVATVKLARRSLVATGAGALTVTYSYKSGSLTNYFPDGSALPTVDTVVSSYLGYQLSAANITLTNMDVGPLTLAAYGTRQVSVQANINGVASTSTPVQVNFSATCGQVSPATASTNSSGLVLVTYAATDTPGTTLSTLGCSGKTVEINASTLGAPVVTKALSITGAPASNMSFVGVTPSRIFLANSGGPTQAIAEFKVVNARGEALAGQEVVLTLKTLNGGNPKASFGAVGSVTSISATTNADGKVSVPVFSGTVPTNVVVNAALISNLIVQTDSAILAIASGRPAQARVSLSLEKFSIEGANIDGELSTVTMSLADRQGNPVPDGTAVNFVTEGGVMIPPVCTTGLIPGDSRCSVTIRSQNPRPANGLVSILAYGAGEEDFVDANFNNVYDCNESFTDLGTAYRDDTASNGSVINPFIVGEFSVPRAASLSICGDGVTPSPQAGDGVWGAADVRKQAVMVFATSVSNITGSFADPVELLPAGPITPPSTTPSYPASFVTPALSLVISDLNGNSVPTGSSIDLSITDNTADAPVIGRSSSGGVTLSTCSIVGTKSFSVLNTLGAFTSKISLQYCTKGDLISVKVTTPRGTITSRDLPIP